MKQVLLKVSKNLFKGVFKRILNKEMNTRTKEVWSPIRLPIIWAKNKEFSAQMEAQTAGPLGRWKVSQFLLKLGVKLQETLELPWVKFLINFAAQRSPSFDHSPPSFL